MHGATLATRFDRVMRAVGIAVLVAIALYVHDLRGDVERISGPVCAQLRDVTDRTRFNIEVTIARDRNVLDLHERGEVVQTPERLAALHRELSILTYQLDDLRESPC